MKDYGLHGLWQFHRAAKWANRHRKDNPFRWWIADECEEMARLISFDRAFCPATDCRPTDAIQRCAFRYFRRFCNGVFTIGEWNDLVYKIGRRGGFRSPSIKAACYQSARNDLRMLCGPSFPVPFDVYACATQ